MLKDLVVLFLKSSECCFLRYNALHAINPFLASDGDKKKKLLSIVRYLVEPSSVLKS